MIIFLLTILSLNIFSEESSIADKRYINYLDISFIQGIRKIENTYLDSGQVNSSFGFLYKYDDRNSFFANISLDYEGEPVDFKRSINERSINTSFTGEWRRSIDKNMFRFHINYSDERFKEGSINTFKENIYNNTKKGFGLNYDINYVKDFLSFGFLYRKIEFPNYTDLLNEIRNQNYSNEGGLYNNNFYRFDVKLKYLNYFSLLAFNLQNYTNQKVLNNDGTYGNDKEKNKSYDFKFGLEEKIFDVDLYPSIMITLYRSNQNFLRFKSVSDINHVFVQNAYSYNESKFLIPFSYSFNNNNLDFEFKYTQRNYIDRNARNSNNDYISEKQKDRKTSLTFSFSRKINKISEFVIIYSYLFSSSTNKYDVYFPLNYNSNYIAIGYKINY
jgi:hypothetical protein